MAYDINAALRPLDALGAISSGQQAAQGFQTLRNNAQPMRSRAAMARALQGDRTAMADIQDPEMLAKLQEHFRQQDIREGIKGFYNTLDQDRIGVNNLATLASAKPKGFDLAGATQYVMSQGAFEEAKPMLELAKLSAPTADEYMGSSVVDETGDVWGVSKTGWKKLGFKSQPSKPTVSDGRLVQYDSTGVPVVKNLPMTPSEQASADAARSRIQNERERLMYDKTNPSASAQPSIDESKASGFYYRMAETSRMIDSYEKAGKPSIKTSVAGAVPVVGGYLQRKAMTPEQAAYKNAADAWIRAKLRKESGAVIGDDEARSEYSTYFPMPGDSSTVIAQKRELRRIAEQEMKAAAGRAAGIVTVRPASGQKTAPRPTGIPQGWKVEVSK